MNYLKIILLTLSFIFYTNAQESVRPWIGIQIEAESKGVLVKGAFPDTPGQRAGLKTGDIITEIDGKKISTPKELIDLVGKKGVGNEVTLDVLSDKKIKKIVLALEAMPGITELAEKKLLNQKAPTFVATILSKSKAKEFDLSKIKKPTIIEFWATWCGACLQAHPAMRKFAEENKDIQVVAISNEDKKNTKKYLDLAKEKGLISDSITFVQGEGDSIHAKYMVPALPMFILIDKDQIVRQISVGVGRNLFEVFEKAKMLAK